MKYRMSLVSYLNSVPLGWAFTEGPYREVFEVIPAIPSACADQMRRGETDICLLPSIEYQRIPDLKIIPNVAIAAKRRADSILLISQRPIEALQRVAVDTSSRTSVALLNILLTHFYKISVRFTPHPPQLSAMLEEHDAALLIGDPALLADTAGYRVYDLVDEWRRFTGKPFVFAFWVLLEEVTLGDQARLFEKSKRLGLANLDTIIRRYATYLALPAERIGRYFTECINYELDAENLSGLDEFYRLAHHLEMIDKPKELKFS